MVFGIPNFLRVVISVCVNAENIKINETSSELISSGLGAVDNLYSHPKKKKKKKKSIKKINNALEYFYMINISSAANEINVCDKLGLCGL